MKELEAKISQAGSLEELEKVRIELFGKRGVLALEFAKLKDIPNPKRRALQGLK